MNMHADIRISLYALLIMAMQPVFAAPVYTWTDAEGVTHFSEVPPPGQDEALQLELEPYPAPGMPEDDYFSVINQAARMESRRLERERLEAQRMQAEAEARRAHAEAMAAREAAAGPAQPPPATGYLYFPGYPYRSHRPHPPYRPHPEHWGRYPPYRPDYRHDAPDFTLNRPPAMRRPGYH
jgi:hypothetical protein